jgi:hypothetical protein
MTTPDRRQEERRLADERCVDAVLAEAGWADDAELRAVLLEMRSLRVTDIPEPSAEVAALMGEPRTADVISLADWPRKHRRKKRAVFTSLAVAASLGIAGGAAAGNDGLRSQAEGTIRAIFSSFTNPTPTTPAPAPPAKAPEPIPAVPSPAVPADGTAPPAPAPVTVPTAGPSSGERQASSPGPERGRQPQKVGAPSAAPGTGRKPAEPGVSGATGYPSQGNNPPAGGTPGNGNDNGNGRGSEQGGFGRGGIRQDWHGQGAGEGRTRQDAGQHQKLTGEGNRP